jgi:hypothetical protein
MDSLPAITPAYLRVIRDRQQIVPIGPELKALSDALCREYGDSVAGMMFYGSCLRSGEVLDGLVDLYVIVDSYTAAYGIGLAAGLNRLLPPNVFYLELKLDERTVRAKYAVLSMDHFQRGTAVWFQPYVWGRFAQPVGVLWVRDETASQRLLSALGRAVLRLCATTLPMLPARFTSKQLWERGLALSYSTELRPERSNRNIQIFGSDDHYYRELTAAALPHVPATVLAAGGDQVDVYDAQQTPLQRRLGRIAWTLRKIQGRALHVLRLVKGVFTFTGGLDYVLWKLERHSGVRIEPSDRVRRHPLIFGWGLMWRLYRRGAFR